jgi:hypothetical protein
VRNGLVGRIELGQTEMAKIVCGLCMVVTTCFQHPYCQVTCEDGETEKHTGREKARTLKLKVNQDVF